MIVVSDWQTRLRGRIFQQFRGLPNITAVADAIAAEAQAFEDAAGAVLTITSIDLSTGAQLQVLGRIVGQGYTGEDEPTFRLRIKARIAANRSSGLGDDLYAVFCAALGLSGTGHALVVPLNPSPAALVFRSFEPLDFANAAVLFDLLSTAKVAGVRLVFEWPFDDDLLVLDDANGLTQFGSTYLGDDADALGGGVLAGSMTT